MLLKHISVLKYGCMIAAKLHNSILVHFDSTSLSLKLSENFLNAKRKLVRKQIILLLAILMVISQAMKLYREGTLDWFQTFLLTLEVNIWICTWRFPLVLAREAPVFCLYVNGLVDSHKQIPTQIQPYSQVPPIQFLNLVFARASFFSPFTDFQLCTYMACTGCHLVSPV